MTKIKIYRDTGADISKLKNIASLCEFYQFPHDSPDRPKKHPLLAMPSEAQWNDCHAAPEEFPYITWGDFKESPLHSQIEAIIGKGLENRRDVLHFDSACKTKCKIFRDIWSKRAVLEPLTGIKIFCTPLEFEAVIEYCSRLANPLAGMKS